MITYTSESGGPRADALVKRIEQLQNGAAAATVRADLRLLESPAIILKATLAAFSTQTIDILVNNARILHSEFLDVCRQDHLRKLFFMQQVNTFLIHG